MKPAPKRNMVTLSSGLPVSGDRRGSFSAAATLALYAARRSSVLAIASLMKLSFESCFSSEFACGCVSRFRSGGCFAPPLTTTW